jgi:hypothetical protein
LNERPPHLYELIHNEDWLKAFCTYKQERAILHLAHEHPDQRPDRIIIEEGVKQNYITLRLETGAKMTF